MVATVAAMLGCAHRKNVATADVLLSPSPPRHAVDDSQRADEGVRGERRNRDSLTGTAQRQAMDTESRPTDSAPTLSHPTGTSWSIVVGSKPGASSGPAADKTAAANRSAATDSKTTAGERRTPWQRRIDIIGGSVGVLCCILALRKRARLSNPHDGDLAA
jgi:hypothetical protein